MDSRANLSPTKTTNAKARPEVVRVRQLETASALVDRSVGCQYLNSGTNGVPMTSKQQTRRNSPMRANSMESVMIASPDDVRMAKQSRLTCYHHDTPMPLRYQERLSYNIPNEGGTERDTALEFWNFGLSPNTSVSTSSPCLDSRARGKELKCSYPDYREYTKRDYDYQRLGQTGGKFNAVHLNTRENRVGNNSCHCSNEIGFRCSLRNSQIHNTILGPAEERLDMPHNREPILKTSRKDNKQKSKNSLLPNPKFAKDRERDSPYLLLSNNSEPKRFIESVARCKSSLSGLRSNVDEIKLDDNLQHEIQTDLIAYSATDHPRSEHQGTEAIRIINNAHNRENNNREEFTCRGLPSQIRKHPKNLSTEYQFTKEPARGQFSSQNGAKVWHSGEDEGLFSGQSSDCITEGHTARMKQGFVRELNSDLVKRSPEQSRYNSRSVVQLVFGGNKPDKEKEADKFITLIDESFAEFCTDKACVIEKPLDDKLINGVNIGRRAEGRQCLKLKEYETICPRDIEGNSYCATGRESCTPEASTQDCNKVEQQSLCRKLDPCANKPKAFPEGSSFEQIKRQLFNEAGLSDERNDVFDETTHCPKELNFVRTIHQSVGVKESIGDCIDDDFVYVVNESAGRLAHNNDRNPKSHTIFKTPRGKLAENRNGRSPFIRTIYQDCGPTNDYVNTSGRPVSPFSDSIISAVATCSQDHKRHEYLRLRRRDRRLRYLSEPGIFSTLGLRTLGAMSSPGSGSSCGENSSVDCADIVGSDLRSSELTEQSLRAHTLALKANSPSVRRRPTLDQFFGKVSEQGLQDNISEQSDFSSHSDSVLMVQRTNKVNLTPVSGLVNGGSRSPNKSSRALRLKAWKNRHENIFKSSRTATHGGISERQVETERRIEKPGNPNRQEIADKDNNNICLGDIEANCVKSDGLIGERNVMDVSRPKEILEVTGGNDNKITENASGFVAGSNHGNENNNSVFGESENFHFGFAGSGDMMNGKISSRKSIGSEDSFEEVYVEPDLINCSPPAADRSIDKADSSNHANPSQDSVSDESKDKKDSLDVFVGSASAILERVKRLKLKYNHKTTAISPFSEGKDENGNLLGKSLKDSDTTEGNSSSGCLIPSPTLLKDSPKIKTIDIFSKGLNNSDSLTIGYNRKKCKNPDLRSSKRSSSSLDELRQDYSPIKDRGSCYNSEENIYNTWSKTNGTVNEMTTNEAQKLLKCLDNTARIPVGETKEEHKEICEPLFVENELTYIDGKLHRAPCDEANVFVTEKGNEITSEQGIVPETSTFESEGRALIYEQTNSRDKSRSEGLCLEKRTNPKHVEFDFESSKERNNIGSLNGDINGGSYANGIALKAGCNRASPNAYSTQGDNEKLPNDQVNSVVFLKTNNNGATDGSPQCNFISVNKAENTTLFEEDSFFDKNSQAANQGPLNISPLVLFENKEYYNNTEKEKPCSLNGLSSKFEGINSDNTGEISPLAGRKDNIESGEFSYWRDGLSSKVNVIKEESKDSTVELAGISDKAYEGDVCNGISSQLRNDIKISSNQGTYSKAGETFSLDDASDAIERVVNKREQSRKAGNDTSCADGLSQVSVENSFTSVPCNTAEEDSKIEGVKSNSDIEVNRGRGSLDIFQQCASTLPIKEDPRGEHDIDRSSIVDGTGFVNNELDRALIANEDTEDMARAKGVSDLKKQFENYQPKGEKKADVTKGSMKKQLVLNDATQKDECNEAKMNALTKSSSKLGALKSMFESEKTEPFKPPIAKIMSPKFSRKGFAVRSMDTKQASTDNRELNGMVRSSGMGGFENFVDVKTSNVKGRKSSQEGHTTKEKLDGDSRDCVQNTPDNQKFTIHSGNNANIQKNAKVPPPVKRKPSLKRKDKSNTNEVSPKNQDKDDIIENNTSVYKTGQDVVLERKEESVAMKKRIAGKEDMLEDVEKNRSISNSGTLRDDSRTPENAVVSEETQGTLLENSGVRKEEESVAKLSSIAIEGRSHKGEEVNDKQTHLPSDFKDISTEVGILTSPSKADHKTTDDKFENWKEMGAIARNYEGANGKANEQKHSENMKSEVLGACEDADHMNAEETIANLISELEKACILTAEDGFVENGGKKGDIVQLEFDKLADNKETMNRKETNGQWKGSERRLGSNQENMLSIASETISKKHILENGCEINQTESVHGKVQDDFPVIVECHGSEGGEIFKSSNEKENASLNVPYYKGKNTSKESDDLGQHICRNNLSNPKADERVQISNTHYVTVETEMTENRSIDQNCKLTSHPLSGLEDPHNLVTKESDGSTKALQLTKSGKDCGTNRGKHFCNGDNGLLNAETSGKNKDQKRERKLLSTRSYSNSSDSSLEESEPVRLKRIDYEHLPTVGLPALLRENKINTEDAITTEEETVQQQQQQQQQQPHHYISYSSIKSHSGTSGMQSRPEERRKNSREMVSAKEHESSGFATQKQDQISPHSDLSDKGVDETENQGLKSKSLTGNVHENINLADETESVEDFAENVACEIRKSIAENQKVIQSSPLTSERNNFLNVAKVSPYFHDRSSRTYTEPATKFGGGIFSDVLPEDQIRADILNKEGRICEDSHTRCTIMRDSDIKGPTMQDVEKLEVVLKVPKGSFREDCINLGVISTDGFSHWNDVEKEATNRLLKHIKLISDDCLGITKKDVEYLQIGRHKVSIGDGKELTRYSKKDGATSRCIVQLQEHWTGSVASLSYQLLIPKRTLEKYLSLVMNHRCLIFCGQSGTGKSYLASKIALDIAGRFSEIGNNNMTEPLHAVNVNAERWKEIREVVLKRASQSMPVILVIDGFTTDFHEGIENLALLLKQVDSQEIYVIAALNQATQEVTVKWQNSIRWIWLDNNEEPVHGLLTRYLRKKFLNTNHGSKELFDIADWISSVWKHVNKIIESFHSAEQTIGPAMFFSCTSSQSDIEEWFADTWNYSLAPYILHTLRTGLKLFGQRCEWIDPLQWIVNTYPWKNEKNLLATLKKIRKSDVGYYDVDKRYKDSNSSSGDQHRLMNFLRRLETMVDNKTIVTGAKPGTTQRRIYLESTL